MSGEGFLGSERVDGLEGSDLLASILSLSVFPRLGDAGPATQAVGAEGGRPLSLRGRTLLVPNASPHISCRWAPAVLCGSRSAAAWVVPPFPNTSLRRMSDPQDASRPVHLAFFFFFFFVTPPPLLIAARPCAISGMSVCPLSTLFHAACVVLNTWHPMLRRWQQASLLRLVSRLALDRAYLWDTVHFGTDC